jgi:hypothetical protein
MTVTLDDYQNALEAFVADLQDGLGDDLVSVLLYGSLARRDYKPGQSDLMDAYVYLKDEVFVEKERFVKAFAGMVTACDRLSRSGLPYQHPFQYWSRHELNHVPALYRAHWWSDDNSWVVFGDDVRQQMNSTEADIAVARSTFLGARRMGHHLAAYLRKRELTETDCEKMLAGVKLLFKFIPAMACVSLDIWTGPKQAVSSLLQALPDQNAASVDHINAFAQKRTVTLAEAEELREILRETLNFFESVHDEILARWRGSVVGAESREAAE